MSRAAVAEPLKSRRKSDADARIRHGDRHGSRRSGAWADGGQIAVGCAAVHSDAEDVVIQICCSGPGQLQLRKIRGCRAGPAKREQNERPQVGGAVPAAGGERTGADHVAQRVDAPGDMLQQGDADQRSCPGRLIPYRYGECGSPGQSAKA
jgi:hypothetical protein